MIKKYGWLIAGLVITLLAVGVLGTTTAFAHGNRPGNQTGDHSGRSGYMMDEVTLTAVADVLGLSTDDLSAALADGSPERAQQLASECLALSPDHPGCQGIGVEGS